MTSWLRHLLILSGALTLLAACSEPATDDSPGVVADVLFLGNHIITMEDTRPTVVAVLGDRIIATGSAVDLMSYRGDATRVVELGERALLPGLIDAHGHFSAVARYQDLLQVSSPPVGVVTSIDDLVERIGDWIETNQIPPGQLVYCYGYDDSLLLEQRHPTRDDLDRISTEHPIQVRHVSGHLLAVNSLALELAGVDAQTANPEGGVIRRRPGSREPDGVMEETAQGLFAGSGSMVTSERMRQLQRSAMTLYASYGITTIQDSNISRNAAATMQQEADAEPYPVDVVAYILANPLNDDELAQVDYEPEYHNGFRVGGVKFTLDGSPQGRTAWMSRPYDQGPPGQNNDYVAYPSYSPDAYLARMPGLIDRGMPVLAHANGDAAIDLMIDGVAGALAGRASPAPDHRSVIIHAQLIRPDQLDRAKDLGIIPSFYSVHPYFWGDWHRLSFGDERAAFISPVAAAVEREIPYTLHNDSPIVPPDMMRLISITVNRQTRDGYVLGPDQRASVMEALRGVTQYAAYQYFEEDEKGSIAVGKRADLVILDANPLEIDPADLAELDVLETFARGVSVYRR